jgi:hypothetical protein
VRDEPLLVAEWWVGTCAPLATSDCRLAMLAPSPSGYLERVGASRLSPATRLLLALGRDRHGGRGSEVLVESAYLGAARLPVALGRAAMSLHYRVVVPGEGERAS